MCNGSPLALLLPRLKKLRQILKAKNTKLTDVPQFRSYPRLL